MNATRLGLQPGQEIFEGEFREAMHDLVQKGHTSWSTADIMDARNRVAPEHPLWKNYISTDFGIVSTPKKIYLAPRSQRLHTITPETILTTDGGLSGIALMENDLKEMTSFNRKDLILGRNMTEEEARTHPLWLAFAHNDQSRLNKYIENTFRFGKDQFDYTTMLNISLPIERKPIEQAVTMDRMYYGLRAYGNDLDSKTCFVGVSLEKMQKAAQKQYIPSIRSSMGENESATQLNMKSRD